jgi:hypothetical protein
MDGAAPVINTLVYQLSSQHIIVPLPLLVAWTLSLDRRVRAMNSRLWW